MLDPSRRRAAQRGDVGGGSDGLASSDPSSRTRRSGPLPDYVSMLALEHRLTALVADDRFEHDHAGRVLGDQFLEPVAEGHEEDAGIAVSQDYVTQAA